MSQATDYVKKANIICVYATVKLHLNAERAWSLKELRASIGNRVLLITRRKQKKW